MIRTTKQQFVFDNISELHHIKNFEEDHPYWKKQRYHKITVFTNTIDEVIDLGGTK